MPIAVDAQTAWPAIAEVRRRPGWAEVLAVGVIDLDSGGEIDDVEAVLRVDGDRPRADDVAGLVTLLPPDELRRRRRPTATGERGQQAGDGRETVNRQMIATEHGGGPVARR